MKKLKTITYAFKEMHRLENTLIPATVTMAAVTGVKPFINIWFSAKIIDLLDTGDEAKYIIGYICLAASINFVMFFLNKYLDDIYYMLRSMLYNRELKSIASKLFSIEFKKLEDNNFKELIHKHTEAQERVFSAFMLLSWMLREFISGTLTVIISVVLILPIIKIGFQKTGDTFFENPIFILSLFGMITVMVIIILIVASRMSKQLFKASDEYSRLDKIFYYFLDMFSDYKTGKEIRLYKEQDIIEKTATHKILTEGEQVLKKAAINSAKSSSFIAILGSVVGFGVYLFIGVKGLFGLFGIGSLVLYCGSFMQIISGVMKMTVIFGKTEEVVPLVNYYYEIIHTKDDMVYGEKEIDLTSEFEIEFKDVSFKYPGGESYALENINLTIHNGEHLAVVGRNGSGKTTFIKLMCRLYDVDSGEILINGINIKEYSKESLMKLYSVVFQDFKLFAVPLCDNISANKEYDRENLYRNMSVLIDAKEHYQKNLVTQEFADLDECPIDIQNIGWTLGNDCPYHCKHCYSMSAREKGQNLTEEIILKVINQLKKLDIKTINLGGNEPLFTNGVDPKNSLLPFIIDCLDEMKTSIGLTTSGITAIYLEKHFNRTFKLLNDIDVSIDSPYENEHNENRGNKIFKLAIETLELCKAYNKECTIIMCAMNWNFTEDRIIELVNLAKKYNANIRVNPIKPVESKHMSNNLTIEQYYAGFSLLMKLCDNLDLTEPTLAGISDYELSNRCPCGRKSFRIHSITPDGKIPISPCVYLHDYKVGDLLVDDIRDLIMSEAFKAFRRRNKHPEKILGCADCELLNNCGGGCAARAYLYNLHTTGNRTLFVKDPFCPKENKRNFDFEKNPKIISNVDLVHKDYLCTWIGKPK